MTLNSTSDRPLRWRALRRGVMPCLLAAALLLPMQAVAQPDGPPPAPPVEPAHPWDDGDSWQGTIRGGNSVPFEVSDPRDGDGHDGSRYRRGGRPDTITEDEARQAFPIIELLQPDLAAELRELGERDPRRLRETMQRRFPGVRYLINLKERDPETYRLRIRDLQLNRETRDVARAIQAAGAADREDEADDLTETLEERVTEHFDVRQALRERELDVLRERIERMQEQLEDRADERDDLIEERVEELVGAGRGPSF